MKKASLWQAFLAVAVFLIAIVWFINTLNTGNALWFSPVQPVYTPSRIIVHGADESVKLEPGDAGFQPLATALSETLSDFRSRDLVPIGLSDETLQEYYDQGVAVEVFYAENVQFNIAARLNNVNTLLFPIDGRHSDVNYVFIGRDGAYQAGALQVQNRAALDSALQQLGYANIAK